MLSKYISFLETEKQYSKLTISSYKRDISQFLTFIEISDFDLEKVSYKDIRGWVMDLAQKGYTNSSINRKISSIKGFFGYLNGNGFLKINPATKVTTLRKGRILPKFIEKSTMSQIVDDMLFLSDDYFIERDTTIILLLYATGLRVSELTEMKIDDLQGDISSVKVNGKGNKERIVPVINELKEKIKKFIFLRNNICNSQNKLLFLSNSLEPINRSAVYRIVYSMLTKYGVEGKKSPHVLRHTFATHLLGNGAGIETVKELLGHESLATTQIYTHNNIEQLKDTYAKAHPRGDKSNRG
ncbi:MAG: tyrosine-type recombinase/integrase [Rikenellaceae bacterium]